MNKESEKQRAGIALLCYILLSLRRKSREACDLFPSPGGWMDGPAWRGAATAGGRAGAAAHRAKGTYYLATSPRSGSFCQDEVVFFFGSYEAAVNCATSPRLCGAGCLLLGGGARPRCSWPSPPASLPGGGLAALVASLATLSGVPPCFRLLWDHGNPSTMRALRGGWRGAWGQRAAVSGVNSRFGGLTWE